MPNPVRLRSDSTIQLCAVICFLAFGGFVAWAGLVELEEGVAASGQVVVEDNRRLIQHLEGGIVETVAVKEGSHVKKGDTLLVLTNTAGQAAKSELIYQGASLWASIIRRDAQISGVPDLDFSPLKTLELPALEIENIIQREQDLFERETAALAADMKLLRGRENSARSSTIAIRAQQESSREALLSLKEQLESKVKLANLQLVRIDEVRVLEREMTSTQSEISRLQNQIERALSDAADYKNQLSQTLANYNSELSESRLEAKRERQIVEERLIAARDVVDRTIVTAPQSGEVLNLTAHTIGGVVKAGEPIMEIVPVSNSVIASVKINPGDRASVSEGLIVRAQITAFDNREVPELRGEIVGISGDLKTDLQGKQDYYEARIRLAVSGDDDDDPAIIPGLPVSVFIFSGAKRTTLEHLFDPLAESMFAGLRGR